MRTADLAMTKRERKEYYSFPKSELGPEYPHDSCLTLDRDNLKELGLRASNLPEAGTEVTISGRGFVKSVQVEVGDEDEDSIQLEIQITDFGFERRQAKGQAVKAKIEELS